MFTLTSSIRDATRLVPIFHHNAMDILTLACLTAIVPAAFGATDCESLANLGVSHGADLAGLARWLLAGGEHEQALALFQRALKAGLSDSLLFRTLWDIATIEKKLSRPDAALAIFVELAGCRNEFRVRALEELAKFYEHSEKNLVMALDFTYQALSFTATAALLQERATQKGQARKDRLHRRLVQTARAQTALSRTFDFGPVAVAQPMCSGRQGLKPFAAREHFGLGIQNRILPLD